MTPTPEERELKRKDHNAKVSAAWAELALSPAFQTVMADAQLRFGMFQPSFLPSDGYNPHSAAKRDGNKEVLADFARRLARGVAFAEDETTAEKPTSAVV